MAESEMIERVKAALRDNGVDWTNDGRCSVAEGEEAITDAAREAIKAIRRPDMNAALAMGRKYGVKASLVDLIWTGMIDAALSPSTKD